MRCLVTLLLCLSIVLSANAQSNSTITSSKAVQIITSVSVLGSTNSRLVKQQHLLEAVPASRLSFNTSIIKPPARRAYIIKNGPEKHLYHDNGRQIIETCLGPTGVSCSFFF